MSLAVEFAARCRRALGALKTDLPVVAAFPIVREIEPLREAAFGPRSYPGILIESLPRGGWRLVTSVPDVGFAHSAELPERMTDAESVEIRSHLILVVENWLNWSEVRREIPDPTALLESLRWFQSLSAIELMQRAAGVGRLNLLPVFKLSTLRESHVIDCRYLLLRPMIVARPIKPRILPSGSVECMQIMPERTAIDELSELILAGLNRSMGPDVARNWNELSAGIGEWRAEIHEQKFRWERDHSCELSPADDLIDVFGDEVAEQTERLRTDAGALIRLIERARDVAEPKPAEGMSDPWVVVEVADCKVRSTVYRHSKLINKGVEATSNTGEYRIRKSRLKFYLKTIKLQKYLTD
jgi:hypothetical protein